jgi:hypothetical protein
MRRAAITASRAGQHVALRQSHRTIDYPTDSLLGEGLVLRPHPARLISLAAGASPSHQRALTGEGESEMEKE